MIPSDHSPRLILSNCPAAAITVGSYPKINFAQVGRIRSSPRMDRLGAGRPLFHRKFGHWEIPDVGGGQAGANSDGSGRNEAVGLVQGHSAICELATPRPGADSLGHTERREASAFTRRRATSSSPGRKHRQISSTEIAQSQGSVPTRRSRTS